MATNFSTLEALTTLCTSIPVWNARLDELNGHIALRQIELARLTENERPSTRSLKNKGSTESLRLKDNHDSRVSAEVHDQPNDILLNPLGSPEPKQNEFSRPRSPASPAAARACATSPHSSGPGRSPEALTRITSAPKALGRTSPAALRKRKTGSVASGESLAPRYRTRSMIIVYYDSAVQTAFEDLVKFVSGSRNSMRKGKMAAKMAEMQRAAELEIDDDDDDDDEDGGCDDFGNGTTNGNGNGNGKILLAASKSALATKQGETLAVGADADNGPDMAMPKLNCVSTRQTGPSMGTPKAEKLNHMMSIGLMGGYRRGAGDAPDIFDELDKGLEWCQSQCEHAAHQFLREGDCSTEIQNIQQRLGDVKTTAENEVEKLKKEGAEVPKPRPNEGNGMTGMKTQKPSNTKIAALGDTLEVDDMEADDDGDDDLGPPPKLVFKRSRDVGI
ncbi:uncharacterized protein L3040_004964 [Drepanopeziza brunnea f. sp. 'multigermtubi']|uniref:Uncharacterized protein n=1 Tax=Marssonina brunnea f. sp. multigermtubi (strain MB_m1) TaxID=1072389 RepID=K1X9I6_MARBU|nr:uncharacterized protein MBM_00854 [Drepanopeziza brunnea f. sp. 'multigermtubi' MB_m1]EKD21741.1 hypothetical protein MBM_00854 [Drepanopeziza brunnea f. sp. 'multigermtubi' MB_m1]KAJ5042415.1 hypothetical protein L3040_004964 [Drepanopeziza brunnea f. sp. 'multigermtubi']